MEKWCTLLRSITNVIGFLGETKGGDPVPLRKSEVNRLLGKVDELATAEDNVNYTLRLR